MEHGDELVAFARGASPRLLRTTWGTCGDHQGGSAGRRRAADRTPSVAETPPDRNRFVVVGVVRV